MFARHPSRRLLLLGLLSAFGIFPFAPLASAQPSPPREAPAVVSSIGQFWRLSPEAKQHPVPFRFECVVTYYDSEWGMLWVQDADSAAYVIPGPRPLPLQAGQRILVTGTNPAGPELSFADASFQVVALASPAPLPLDNRLEQVQLFKNRLVSVDAVVDRLAPPISGHQQYLLSIEGRPALAWLRLGPGQKPPDLANSRVRITGVYNPSLAPDGELAVLTLMVATPERLQLICRLENDPTFELPRTPVDQLPDCPANTLVHLMGVAVAHLPGHSLQLRDNTGQIELLSAQTVPCAIGSPVEAVGYPRVIGTVWQLANAAYRPLTRPDGQPATPDPAQPLRLVAQVSALPASAAAAAHPVRLTGVVTWSHPESPFFFIQDASGGLCIQRGTTGARLRPPGRRVEISGTTTMGPFAPAVEATDIVKLGDIILPTPKAVSLDHAMTGAEEAQLVEMTGYVRRIQREGPWAKLEVATEGGDFIATVATAEPLDSVPDSVVRLRGVCSAQANDQRQLQSIQLWLADTSSIQIVEPAPADSFERPLHAIASLGRYGSIQTYEHRIKVHGTVTHHTPGVAVQILEDSAPLLVLSRDPAPLAQGDQIDAVGFLGRQGQRLALREARVRKAGTASLPAPRHLAAPEQLLPDNIGQLVQIDGQLIATASAGDKLRLTIQADNRLFEAYLSPPAGDAAAAGLPWPVGSLLTVTGVYDLQYDAYGRPALLQLHVQDQYDVLLRQRPPWLDRSRILALAALLAVGILLVALWGATLRRRVRRQTDQIRRQLARESHLEAELQRTSKLESLGLLAGGIAHDFNNLLTVVMGNLSLLKLDPGLDADSTECLQEAENAIGRSRDLTMQLLTFAKGGDPVRTSVALADVVQEATRFALHGSTVRAAFELAPGLWPAEVDQGQISQVVQNIVMNAAQAMPQGGRIRVELANETVPEGDRLLAPGRYLRLTLADDGPGISPEALPRIFDPYFTTKKTGHGIGLATVHSIIKKHGGHITVASTLGQGTVFKIWLPAAAAAPAAAQPAALATRARARGRALVLDDEESIRRLATAMLGRLGLETVAVADGADALRAYAEALHQGHPFALVILDLTIPGGLGGEETMRELLKIDPEVRAIVSSGYSNNPVLADHRSYGFKGMVSKPYELADLGLVVDRLLLETAEPR
ncbi:MAG: response regulator [Opitutaceae bacterium]|nr:response regulator [Opitutaceae bacterium]